MKEIKKLNLGYHLHLMDVNKITEDRRRKRMSLEILAELASGVFEYFEHGKRKRQIHSNVCTTHRKKHQRCPDNCDEKFMKSNTIILHEKQDMKNSIAAEPEPQITGGSQEKKKGRIYSSSSRASSSRDSDSLNSSYDSPSRPSRPCSSGFVP